MYEPGWSLFIAVEDTEQPWWSNLCACFPLSNCHCFEQKPQRFSRRQAAISPAHRGETASSGLSVGRFERGMKTAIVASGGRQSTNRIRQIVVQVEALEFSYYLVFVRSVFYSREVTNSVNRIYSTQEAKG